jgi:hypothetical protein
LSSGRDGKRAKEEKVNVHFFIGDLLKEFFPSVCTMRYFSQKNINVHTPGPRPTFKDFFASTFSLITFA